jgi:hypothetical protein
VTHTFPWFFWSTWLAIIWYFCDMWVLVYTLSVFFDVEPEAYMLQICYLTN